MSNQSNILRISRVSLFPITKFIESWILILLSTLLIAIAESKLYKLFSEEFNKHKKLVRFFNEVKGFTLLKFFKLDISKDQIEDRTYANFVAIVVFVLPIGGIVSWFERPDLIDVALLQILVGILSVFFIEAIKRFRMYFKFTFCMFLLSVIFYCFFATGGIKGTLHFYWIEGLILTWVLLSDDRLKVYTSTLIHFWVFFQMMDISIADLQSTSNHVVREVYATMEIQIQSFKLHGFIIAAMLVILMNSIMDLRQKIKQEIDELLHTDELTRVSNRYHMKKLIAEYEKSAADFNHNHVLIMFDFDNFKAINDADITHHKIGDEALVGVSRFISNRLRNGDFIARWGGDEFVILLANTRLRDGVKKANEIRLAISKLNNITSKSDLFITLSFGVAEMQPGSNGEEVLNLADMRLKIAKDTGRNKVCG